MRGNQPPEHLPERLTLGTVNPAALAEGLRVDAWRVLWRHETGAFGVVYLAVRVGQETEGPCALKLARGQGDARLEREVELLARVQRLAEQVPPTPRQGQKRPPCTPRWEVEINGGCWGQMGTLKPPCAAGWYAHQGACYLPVPAPQRPSTSKQP